MDLGLALLCILGLGVDPRTDSGKEQLYLFVRMERACVLSSLIGEGQTVEQVETLLGNDPSPKPFTGPLNVNGRPAWRTINYKRLGVSVYFEADSSWSLRVKRVLMLPGLGPQVPPLEKPIPIEAPQVRR
jgi:hypothetical protein